MSIMTFPSSGKQHISKKSGITIIEKRVTGKNEKEKASVKYFFSNIIASALCILKCLC